MTDRTWTHFAASRYLPSDESPFGRMYLGWEIERQADVLLEKLGRTA